ncbi:MAG: hypothetical protein LBF05_01830, partial [Tannerella sp.]|nr:hypothetical protein [Tannerella sp.]
MARIKHSKKKKYISPAEQQRQQEEKYKRFFFDKLRHLCKQIGDESLYDTIPLTEKLTMYYFRGAPLKIVAAKGAKIKKQLAEVLMKTIRVQQQTMTLEVVKGGKERMTFADYSLVGMSLEYNLSESPSQYPAKKPFAGYAELRDERGQIYEDGLRQICASACWLFDDMEKKYLHTYTLDISVPAFDSGYIIPNILPTTKASAYQRTMEEIKRQDFRMHKKITIGTHPLEVRKVKVNGEVHTAIQTGAMFFEDGRPEFIPFKLSMEDINTKLRSNPSNTSLAKLRLPIYIQQHALDRMKERIGAMIPCFYKAVIMHALLHKEILSITKKRLLIACFTDELKIGYFVAEITDGIILIRTFLLITNSGTPEGEKLTKLTGLQAEDHKYLSIDTLQGLANSDIEQNE